MYIEVKLKLITNFLGGGSRKSGVRQLKRTSDNRIAIDENDWRSDISEAAESLGLDFNTTSIKFELGFDPVKVCTLRRTYNKVNVEMFEGIPSGTNLSIFLYADKREENCPSLKDIKKVIEVFGKFFGISQFGKKFQCGRFEVKEINLLDKNNYK